MTGWMDAHDTWYTTLHKTQAYIEGLSGINLYDVRTFQGYDFIDQVTFLDLHM